MARTVWANLSLSTNTDLQLYEPNITSLGVSTLADKHTLAKAEIADKLRLHLAEYKGDAEPKQEGADMVSTASSTVVSAAGASFLVQKVTTYDRLWIGSGSDKGVHTIAAVSTTTLGLGTALTAADTALSYWIEPEVLDLIKNPAILTRAAALLALHYAAIELATEAGQYWDEKQKLYRAKFEQAMDELVPNLALDIDQDDVISSGERNMRITGGRLIR